MFASRPMVCSSALTAHAHARRESDEEFRERLLGSDTPQAQRIVTGVDPRLAAAEAEEAAAEEAAGGRPAGAGGETWGTRLDKLADDELSPEDREAKRNTELWKGGNKAKEFSYKWKVKCLPNPNPLATPCAVLCCAPLGRS